MKPILYLSKSVRISKSSNKLLEPSGINYDSTELNSIDHILHYKNASVETSDWTVSVEGKILEQSKYMISRKTDKKLLNRFSVYPRYKNIPYAILIENSGTRKNYYHWLDQSMVSLFCYLTSVRFNRTLVLTNKNSLKKREIIDSKIVLLVHDGLSTWQSEWLNLLDISDSLELLSIPSRNTVFVNELIVPAFLYPPYDYFPNANLLRGLRDEVLNNPSVLCWKKKIQNKFPKIYISRADSNKGRGIVNSMEVDGVLRSLGFEIIKASEWPVAAQVALFNNASLIVAPHGAGLTNIIFAGADARVIEINQDEYLNRCFSAIWFAIFPNRPYFHFICASIPVQGLVQHVTSLKSYHNNGIYVDVQELSSLIADVMTP